MKRIGYFEKKKKQKNILRVLSIKIRLRKINSQLQLAYISSGDVLDWSLTAKLDQLLSPILR